MIFTARLLPSRNVFEESSAGRSHKPRLVARPNGPGGSAAAAGAARIVHDVSCVQPGSQKNTDDHHNKPLDSSSFNCLPIPAASNCLVDEVASRDEPLGCFSHQRIIFHRLFTSANGQDVIPTAATPKTFPPYPCLESLANFLHLTTRLGHLFWMPRSRAITRDAA